MTAATNPKQFSRCKKIRRYGRELDDLLSGVTPTDKKCKVDLRPGQHGSKQQRLSDYGVQLREKLKLRYLYGILEKQFRRYFKEASRQKGSTGLSLLIILERRLDNVLYRAGFALTRAEARQMVSHKHVLVNGKIVNRPSYPVKVGDIVEVREKAKSHARIAAAIELASQRSLPEWFDIDSKAMSATMKRYPERDELPATINESLIVELYSK